jgi:hypothetical protein
MAEEHKNIVMREHNDPCTWCLPQRVTTNRTKKKRKVARTCCCGAAKKRFVITTFQNIKCRCMQHH